MFSQVSLFIEAISCSESVWGCAPAERNLLGARSTPGPAPGGRIGGASDCFVSPFSAKICSCDAVPPYDDVGVPPTVIARYSLPCAL